MVFLYKYISKSHYIVNWQVITQLPRVAGIANELLNNYGQDHIVVRERDKLQNAATYISQESRTVRSERREGNFPNHDALMYSERKPKNSRRRSALVPEWNWSESYEPWLSSLVAFVKNFASSDHVCWSSYNHLHLGLASTSMVYFFDIWSWRLWRISCPVIFFF